MIIKNKNMRQLIILFICMAGVLFQTGTILALMPPHYMEIEPLPGGPLAGDTITITGYSLAYTDSPSVTDLNTGEILKPETDINVEMVGHGLDMKVPPPGSTQEHSVMTVVLPPIKTGHRIEIRFLDETFTWTKSEAKSDSGTATEGKER